MTARCMACSYLTLSLPGGVALPPDLRGMGQCVVQKPGGAHGVFVALNREMPCGRFAPASEEQRAAAQQAFEADQARRACVGQARQFRDELLHIRGRENRAARLAEIEAQHGRVMRQAVEESFLTVWNLRKKEKA